MTVFLIDTQKLVFKSIKTISEVFPVKETLIHVKHPLKYLKPRLHKTVDKTQTVMLKVIYGTFHSLRPP